MAGTGIGLGETAIKHLNGVVGHIREGLRKEGHEHGIPTRGRGTLEGLSARLARELCQEREAVGMQRLQWPRVHIGAPQEAALVKVSENGPWGVGDSRASQPSQGSEAPPGVRFEEGIKPPPAVCREQRGELAKRFGL